MTLKVVGSSNRLSLLLTQDVNLVPFDMKKGSPAVWK
jgi:hypothetical protein